MCLGDASGYCQKGESECVIKLWNIDSTHAPKDLLGYSRSVDHVTFSPDGKLLASCGEDDTRIMIWNVAPEALREVASLPHIPRGGKGFEVFSKGFEVFSKRM